MIMFSNSFSTHIVAKMLILRLVLRRRKNKIRMQYYNEFDYYKLDGQGMLNSIVNIYTHTISLSLCCRLNSTHKNINVNR